MKPITKRISRLMDRVGFEHRGDPATLARNARLINLIAQEAAGSAWHVEYLVSGGYALLLWQLEVSSDGSRAKALSRMAELTFSAMALAVGNPAPDHSVEAAACRAFPGLQHFLHQYQQHEQTR